MNEDQTDTVEDSISEDVVVRRGRPPKAKSEASEPEEKKFPVKLLRNYRVAGDFTIGSEEPTDDQRLKMFAGASIEVSIDEAMTIMSKGIAVRNDPIG